MKKIIFHPYLPVKYLKMEDWLYAMSKKGFFLQYKFLFFFVFRCDVPIPTNFFWYQCFQRGDYTFFAEAQAFLGDQFYAINEIHVPCFSIEPNIRFSILLKYKRKRNIIYQKRYKSLGTTFFVASLLFFIICLVDKFVIGYHLVMMLICFTVYYFVSLFILKQEAKSLTYSSTK